jgi:hypothetical protein
VQYKLITDVAGDVITQHLKHITEESEHTIATWIANTRELQLTKALISMGWVPPNHTNNAPTMQKLIDATFEIALMISSIKYDLYKLPDEEKAKWIAEQLRDAGFDTEPCGASWGILDTSNDS